VHNEKQAEFVRLYVRANALYTQAEEAYEMARKLEDLAVDTTLGYG
jgi:hypothetical protein